MAADAMAVTDLQMKSLTFITPIVPQDKSQKAQDVTISDPLSPPPPPIGDDFAMVCFVVARSAF